MPKSAGYVDSQALKMLAMVLREPKQRSYDAMRLQPGSHVLDLGCGPGIDTIPFGRLVGPNGRVVGLDLDEEMIAQANQLASQSGVGEWVTHRQGSVETLPFDDAAFDACHADRLFQVLPASIDPQHVCGEVVRVLKPGGRFVAMDADWGTLSVDSKEVELEGKLTRFFAERLRPNGFAGRQLHRLFMRQGLVELTVELHPMYMSQAAQSLFGGDWIDREAVAAGVITESERERWRAGVEQADADGEFFAIMCMVTVVGRKPGL